LAGASTQAKNKIIKMSKAFGWSVVYLFAPKM